MTTFSSSSSSPSFPQRSSRSNPLFHYACAPIQTGQSRGKSLLGIPTANFPPTEAKNILHELKQPGIYYGLATIIREKEQSPSTFEIYPMVASLGWNPFFRDRATSFEVHLIDYEGPDFYGQTLAVLMMGFLRNEENYPSLDDLRDSIWRDVGVARRRLEIDPRVPQARQHLLELSAASHPSH